MTGDRAGTELGWIAGAGAVGLAVSAVFSSVLRLPRGPFVLVHAVVVGVLGVLFFRRGGAFEDRTARQRSAAGVATGLLVGALLVAGVIGGPRGQHPIGIDLATALGWYGILYGVADAVLLTIIPVTAVRAWWTRRWTNAGPLGWRAAALAASLLVTVLYHAGFGEFRSAALVQPLIGNAAVTAGYLLTGQPATPLLAHVLMHVAAVLHGMEATTQLPPHY